jgi:hypothetical protein
MNRCFPKLAALNARHVHAARERGLLDLSRPQSGDQRSSLAHGTVEHLLPSPDHQHAMAQVGQRIFQ